MVEIGLVINYRLVNNRYIPNELFGEELITIMDQSISASFPSVIGFIGERIFK
jgi:hypothetical protein